MKSIVCSAFIAALASCGTKQDKPAPATSTDCAEAMARIDDLRMHEEKATPEQIQELKDARAKNAAADIRSCTLNQNHSWAECVKTAKTSEQARTSCK